MKTVLLYTIYDLYKTAIRHTLPENCRVVEDPKGKKVDLVIFIQEKVGDPIWGLSTYLKSGRSKRERIVIVFMESAGEKTINKLSLMKVGTHKYYAVYMGLTPDVFKDVILSLLQKKTPMKRDLKVLHSPRFTETEKKVLGELSKKPSTNKNIADTCGMSVEQVQRVLKNARVRFGVKTTHALLLWYHSLHHPPHK